MQKLFFQLGKWWRLFFWNVLELSPKRKNDSLQEHTTHHYLTSWWHKLQKRHTFTEKEIKTTCHLRPQIHELQFDHPPYSPDLASSSFFRFPQLRIVLGRQEIFVKSAVWTLILKRRMHVQGWVKAMGASLREVTRSVTKGNRLIH